jgi:hypothetical protein
MSICSYVANVILLAGTSVGEISDVAHVPSQPKPNKAVIVTARPPAGARKITLKLQAVAPSKYVRRTDPAYEKDWAELLMHDDGKDGDATAGDGIYTARVPDQQQQHRWLTRYRITAVDDNGKSIQSPAADSASPNFAWWCDAGPAAWSGSREPGRTPPLSFSSEFLTTLQSVHLIANADDVARSQWDGAANRQKQFGTIVYRGVVYDHIQYSNRGQASAHIAGKNKWSVKFHDDQRLPFQDHDGVPFPEPIKSLNINPGGSTPHIPVHRGITGLDEVLSLRAYRLAGIPTPPATWIQWRVVASANEVDPKNQYNGDLWGPYVAIGEMDPKLLADRPLPDGLTVSIQSGIKHAPKAMAETAPKEWEKFLNGMRSNPSEAWWRKNLDLSAYFSFHALNRLLANVDLRPDGNHGYYRHPDGRWAPIPWDTDMMFVPRHHQPGFIEAIGCLSKPAIALEYRNRAREILDLFASDPSPRGGQIGQLVADLGSALKPKGYDVDWAKLDEALWNQHPRMNQRGSFFVNPADAHHFGGPWRRTLATKDFAGFQKYIVDFCTDSRPSKKYAPNDGDQRGYGWGYLAHEAKDDQIPATPTIERIGNGSKFKASSFDSPVGKAPAAIEWRVGRVGNRGWYELVDHWRGERSKGTEIEIPVNIFNGAGEYRVRARWLDETGRASHWSAPIVVTR